MPKRITAFQLVQPYVMVHNGGVIKNHQDGTMQIRDKLKKSLDFNDWVLVYSHGKNASYDDDEADMFVDIIKKASVAFGIKIKDPGFITCNSNSNSWKQQIQDDFQKNGKPQIVTLFFNPF